MTVLGGLLCTTWAVSTWWLHHHHQ